VGFAIQEFNICQQLDAGVRYFDLRVARKPDETHPTRLYFYHGLYSHSDVEVRASVAMKESFVKLTARCVCSASIVLLKDSVSCCNECGPIGQEGGEGVGSEGLWFEPIYDLFGGRV